MPKPIELIYSQQSTGFKPGAAYSNPRFFSTPRSGVAKVYLVGDWPKIQEAYEALGVPVEQLDPALAVAGESPDVMRAAPEGLAEKVKARVGRKKRPEPEPEAANGLTRRQMNADLLAAGLEPEPMLSLDDLAALHAELER